MTGRLKEPDQIRSSDGGGLVVDQRVEVEDLVVKEVAIDNHVNLRGLVVDHSKWRHGPRNDSQVPHQPFRACE